MHYRPGGYSWLGVLPEPFRKAWLSPEEKRRLKKDCREIEHTLDLLDGKVQRDYSLVKKYEKWNGTARGEGIFHQMEALKKEIDRLSKNLSKSLSDTLHVERKP